MSKIDTILLKIVAFPIKVTIFILILGIIGINYRLYAPLDTEKSEKAVIFKQLKHLERLMSEKTDENLQNEFPEGYLFANYTYALAWIDVLRYHQVDSTTFRHGLSEINKSMLKINTPEAARIFGADLTPRHGIFYNGWKAFVWGSFFELQPALKYKSALWDDYSAVCNAIAAAYGSANNPDFTPYLESYLDGIWVCDNTVAIAALAKYNKIDTPKYQKTVENWVQNVRSSAELLPFTVTKKMEKSKTRGCSESLILILLPTIDSVFAAEQYAIYTQNFKDSHFGLPFFREHEHGDNSEGDYDSGPVLFGLGPVASLVGIKAARENRDFALSESLRQSAECFGLAYEAADEKTYLLGKLPIVDFFLTWLNADAPRYQKELENAGHWRLIFQAYSLLFIAILLAIIIRY